MKKTITKIMTGLAVLSALSGSPKFANAQEKKDNDNSPKIEMTAADVEYHLSDDINTNRGRFNAFYTLPGNTKAYSFIQLNNKGYMSKTMAYTPLVKDLGLGVKTEIKSSNHFKDMIGVGLEKKFNIAGVNGFVNFIPAYFNLEGYIKNSMTASAGLNKTFDLGNDWSLTPSGFIQIALNAKDPVTGEKKLKQQYGELELQLNKGNFYVAPGIDLDKGSAELGNFIDPVGRVAIGYKFSLN